MPGISRFSIDRLLKDVEAGLKLGINKVLLFGVGDEKWEDAIPLTIRIPSCPKPSLR
jgi:porphobilinogen synthase